MRIYYYIHKGVAEEKKVRLLLCVRSLKGGRGDGSRNSSDKRGLQNLLREQGNDLQQQKYALEARADQTPGEESEGQ